MAETSIASILVECGYAVYLIVNAHVEAQSWHLTKSEADTACAERQKTSNVELFVGPAALIKQGMPVKYS